MMFKKKQRGEQRVVTTPIDGIASALRSVTDLLRDNKGKMSSRRFGAGALVAAGIALVNAGAVNDGTLYQFWGGISLCGMGVVLFGLTKLDPPTAP